MNELFPLQKLKKTYIYHLIFLIVTLCHLSPKQNFYYLKLHCNLFKEATLARHFQKSSGSIR